MKNINKFYTGVGSRKAPKGILSIATRVSKKLAEIGFVLRSGGAQGMDRAFEQGAFLKEIYYASDATKDSMEIAESYHPAWKNMSEFAKKLHGRNPFQVLGKNLQLPSNFLLCWTPDGAINHSERTRATGGTGTAISIASEHGIQVFNLKRIDHLERILNWIE